MATIGKVSAVFTASTSGLTAGVNAASASMKGLRRDSQSLDGALTRLGAAGAAISAIDPSGINATATAATRATAAAQDFEQQAAAIAARMQQGSITAEQAAAALGQLNAQAQQAAATFERGAQVISANATAEQRFAATTAELNTLLAAGAIDQGTFQRAVDAARQSLESATGVTQAKAQAARQMAAEMQRGAQVTMSVQSAEERHAATLAELQTLLQSGAISQQTFGRAIERANEELRQSQPAAAAAAATMSNLSASALGVSGAMSRLSNASAALNAIDPTGMNSTASAALSAAAAAQSFEQASSLITARMQAGTMTAEQAAAAMGQLNTQAQQTAATFERGAQVIAANATAEQRFASTTSELNALLQAGAIDQGTFQRAVDAAQQSLDNATGVTQAQSQAMRQLTATFERGAQVTLSVQSAEERHAATLAELRSLLQAGAISQQTYSRAVDRANDELRQSRPAANAAAAAMSTVSSAASGVTSRLNALIAIQGAQLFGSLISQATRAVQSLIRFGQGQAEVVDQTSKLADRLGFTYGELAGLSLAGDLAGVSMDTIGAAVTRADVAFVRAAEGSRTAAAAFESIGLSVANLQGMSAAERFDAIAAAIAALPTEAQRAEAAIQLFGRAGAQLLPLFAGGAEGIAAARAEAERFGLALTGMQGQNVEAMNDAFTRAQQAVAGVVQQVVAYLAPAIEGVTTAFSDLVGNVGGATIGQTIGDGILQGARFLAQIGDSLIQNLSGVWQYVSQVGAQWAGVWDIAGRVGSVFAGIGRLLQGAFQTIVGSFSSIGQIILTAVREAAAVLGFDTAPLDSALAGLQAFNQQISQDIEASFNAAAENFGAALEPRAAAVGAAIPGPLTQTIDDAIARAQAAAAAVDVAEKQTIEVQTTQRIDARELREAVQGTDSRSAEGIREMFRLMRGDGAGSVQERIARATERAAAALENQEPDEFDVADLAPAAGG